MILEGVYVPLMTPFRRDLALDLPACGRNIDWLIENGVHGIIVGGSTGEFFSLSANERVQQFEQAAKRIDGRLPFIAGINDLQAARCYRFAAAARDAGADALLVAAPPYALPRAAEIAAHCRRIERIAHLPIILYNYPARTGVQMDDDFLRRALRIENVFAIKESSGDPSRIQALVKNFPELQLSAGAEDLVLEFFAWGARSWVSVIANFMPRQAVQLFETCVLRGDFDTGRQLMRALLPLMQCLEQGGTFLQSVKYACELMKRPGGPVRPPLRPLSKTQRNALAAVLRTALREFADGQPG